MCYDVVVSPLPLTDPRPDPPNRSVRLVYSGHFGAANWVNVMWLFLTGSGEITTSDLNTLATACYTPYVSNLMAQLRTSCVLDECAVNLYQDGDLLQGTHTGSGAGGHAAGSDLPASVACAISWIIPSHYRGGHPRTYLCGLASDELNGTKSWSTSFLANMTSEAISFHNAIEAISPIGAGIAGVEHGIISFQSGKQWRTPPIFRRISGALCDTRVDTQRRRLGRDT